VITWLLAEPEPGEWKATLRGFKWILVALLFLIAFYGGLDPLRGGDF
jgi:hypothetical protein